MDTRAKMPGITDSRDKRKNVVALVEEAEDRARFLAQPHNAWAQRACATSLLLRAAAAVSTNQRMVRFVDAYARLVDAHPNDFQSVSKAYYALRDAADEISEHADSEGHLNETKAREIA